MISVVIPAYNESERIIKTLRSVEEYFKKHKQEREIIIVNDGSTDDTKIKAEGLNIKNLRILDNEKNKGKGYSVMRGLLAAKGDFILFMDADGSTPINEVEKFMPHLAAGYDIVIGSRQISGARIITPQPIIRRMLGEIFKIIVKTVIGLMGFADTQCGFKIFKKKAVKDIIPKCKIKGWAFDPEILAISKKLGYKIKEAPIIWTDSPKSKLNLWGMAWAIIDLFRIKIDMIIKNYE